jgi:hypothetical protein
MFPQADVKQIFNVEVTQEKMQIKFLYLSITVLHILNDKDFYEVKKSVHFTYIISILETSSCV